MTKKAIYRHKKTGDLFAIETDEDGKVVSSCGPVLSSDIDEQTPFRVEGSRAE